MYIGLKTLQTAFSDLPNLLTNSDGIHCLTGWNKLAESPKPYLNHLLYTCIYGEDISGYSLESDMHILCIVPEGNDLNTVMERFPKKDSVLFLTQDNDQIIYSRLQTFFNTYCGAGIFGQTLLEFLALDNGLQPAIDYSFRIFGNPVFVFDANFNLLAATWEEIEKRGLADPVIMNKQLSEDDYYMINRRNHIHEKVKRSELPIRAFNEDLGYEQMYCAINTRKDLGHICLSASIKPFEPADEEMLLTLKKYVDQQMKKDSFIRTSRGFNYEYFLKDLLEGKITSGRSFMAQMNYVKSEFFGNMYCMVVETAKSASTINVYHIRNLLEIRFPNTKTVIFNGQIIAILSIPKNTLISEEYIHAAEDLCRENDLHAGMSNCFQDILELLEYYNQALRAIELGALNDNEPGLHVYADHYMDHIMNVFSQKAQPRIFCHPKMQFLLDYDEKHRSQLSYTMYMYLIYERNLAAASEAMGMHRTSLVYRFKKIHSLIGEDFEDPKERMYMILSYEMNKHIKQK